MSSKLVHIMGAPVRRAALIVALLALSACGGGGGSSDKPVTTSGGPDSPAVITPATSSGSLSGTAASGTALANKTVTFKDGNGKLHTTTTDANGHYAFDFKDIALPGVLQVGDLHAPVTSADLGHTVNISQLTDLVLANVAGEPPSAYFDKGDFAAITKGNVDDALGRLQVKLGAVLDVAGVQAGDFLRAAFVPDHTGIDRVLDVLSVSFDPAGNTAMIANTLEGQEVEDLLSAGVEDTAKLEFVDPGIWAAFFSTDANIAERTEAASKLVAQINQALTSSAAGTMPDLGWCDAEGFQDSNYRNCGQWAQALQSLTNQGGNPLVLRRVVAFDTSEVGNVNDALTAENKITDETFGAVITLETEGRVVDLPAIKLTLRDGQWQLSGDQRLVNVAVRGFVNKTYAVRFPEQPNGTVMDYGVAVTAKTSDVTKADGLRVEGIGEFDRWQFVQNQSPEYRQISMSSIYGEGEVPRDGVVYVIKVMHGDDVVATYKTRLLSTGLPSADAEGVAFPDIAEHPGASDCLQGVAKVSWSLPEGYKAVEVTASCLSKSAPVDFTGLSFASKDMTDAPDALDTTLTLSSPVELTDINTVAVKTLAPSGMLVIRSMSYDIASSGAYITANVWNDLKGFLVDANRQRVEQSYVDDYNNDPHNNGVLHIEQGDDLLTEKFCLADQSLLAVNIAPFAALDWLSDFSALQGHAFRNVSCLADTSGHALEVAGDGTITLTSQSLGANGELQTRVFTPEEQAGLLSESATPAENGSITWLRPFEVVWQDVTEYLVMEVTTWPESKKILASFWRMVAS